MCGCGALLLLPRLLTAVVITTRGSTIITTLGSTTRASAHVSGRTGLASVKATHGLTIVTALEERVGRRPYESCHQKWRAPSKKQEPGFTRVVNTLNIIV